MFEDILVRKFGVGVRTSGGSVGKKRRCFLSQKLSNMKEKLQCRDGQTWTLQNIGGGKQAGERGKETFQAGKGTKGTCGSVGFLLTLSWGRT